MKIIEAVKKDEFYRSFTENLTEEEREYVERTLADMTEPLNNLLHEIISLASDENGFSSLTDALDEVTTSTEIDKWHEKS